MKEKTKKQNRLFFGMDVDSKQTPLILLGLVIGLWLFCWIGVVIFVENDLGGGGWSIRGQFGDMFGAVNALFSGLAFAGIIYTILLQREELEAQRKELRSTRREFKRQSATFIKDQFENTFFALIELHEVIISNIASGMEHNGRRYLIDYLNHIQNILRDKTDKIECAKLLRDNYRKIHKSFLESYFRSIKGLLKFIEKGEIEDKGFYHSILYNQFTDTERSVLYYQASLSGDKELKQMYLKAGYFKLIDEYNDVGVRHRDLIHNYNEPENTFRSLKNGEKL